jgi:hypothetical protein
MACQLAATLIAHEARLARFFIFGLACNLASTDVGCARGAVRSLVHACFHACFHACLHAWLRVCERKERVQFIDDSVNMLFG